MASKRVEIDLDDIRRLGALQCTDAEVAAFLRINATRFSKICKKFPEVREALDEGKHLGKTSLRRKQFRLAGSSASMAIHLGKNMLNQRDAISHEVTGAGGGPVQTMDLSKLDKNDRDQLRELLLRTRRSESDSQ